MSREISAKDFVRERLKLKGNVKADEMYDKVAMEINRMDREIQKLLVSKQGAAVTDGEELPKKFICKFDDIMYINNLREKVQIGLDGREHEIPTDSLLVIGGPL